MRQLQAYLLLLGAYMRVNWRSALEYRTNFLFEMAVSLFELGMYIFYWKIFFSISSGVSGMTFNELAALVAFNHVIYAAADTLMGDHIWDAGEMIVRGQIDIFLVQPKSAVYQIFFSGAQPARAVQIVTGTLLFFYIVPLSLENGALFLFGLVVGGSIFASWVVVLQSLVFHLGNTMVVYKLLSVILHFGKKPAMIFSAAVRFVLYTIIPAAFLGTVQTGALFNPDAQTLGLLGFLAVASPLAATFIFRRGMRRYESGNLVGIRT
jgi:ABC-2 type transport system permease protein